jgi:TP901 family phage tail tape measure protein
VTVADRTIRMILKAEVADFKRQMAEAAAATDKIPASAAKADTALGRMVQSARYNREAWDRAGQTMTAFGTATLAGLGLAARAAVNWESQWTGVLKTVDGTAAELGALEDSLREMARTLPASHQEIAAVAEAAGQLGVQTPNVAAFTRVMIDLGETTNLSADEAATSLAQLMNVMQTAAGDVDNLGAAVVALGNNGASTERDIVQMAQRIAGAGKIVGLTEGEVLGLANALASVGIEVEAGGTAISKIMTDMAKAVSTGSDDLAKFAEVAGMTAEQFTTAFETDPASAIASFVEGLGRINAAGGDVFTTLDDLGQSEQRVTRALLTMANSGDLLRDSLALGNQSWADGNALLIEAAKRYDTTASKIEVARNSVNDAAISLGQVFLPAINDAAEGVADFSRWLAGLPVPVQQAAGGIGALAGGVALAGGAFLLVVPRILDTVNAFKTLSATSKVAWRNVGAGVVAVAVAAAFIELADAAQSASVSSEELLNRLIDIEQNGADVASLFSDIGQGFADENLSLVGRIDTGNVDEFRRSLEKLNEPSIAFVNTLNDIAGLDGGLRQLGIRLGDVGDALGVVAETDLGRAQTQFNSLVDAAGGGDEAVRMLLNRMTGYRDALYSSATAQGIVLDETTLLAAATGELDIASGDATVSTAALGDATQYVGESTEAATEALAEWRTTVAEADAAFIDLTDAYQGVIDQNTAYAQSTADATEKSTDSWEDYYDGVTVSSADYIAQLQAQVDAQTAWETNMVALTTKAREGMSAEMSAAADAMISELLDLGPEGAAQVALMASMTDAEFAQVVTLWGQKGTAATDAFVTSVEGHAAPVIPLLADPSSAYAVVESFRRTVSGMTVYMNVAGQDVGFSTGRGNPTGRAFGGLIPGSSPHSRADNVLIRATAGEYMHQVPAVNYWGGGFMDAVNRMDKAAVASQVAGYAYGGQIGVPVYGGGGAFSSPAPIPEPIDYERLARATARAVSHVQIGLDGRSVSQSVDERIGAMLR